MAKTIEIGPYSAYAIAVANGFSGTEQEWLASLIGPKGLQGASVTGAKIDASQHLIITVHDPATGGDTEIDAGEIGTIEAVQAVQQAIQQAGQSAVSAVESAGSTQQDAVASAGTQAISAIGSAQQTAVQQVQQAGQESIISAQQEAEKASSSATQASESASAAASSASAAQQSQSAASSSATQASESASAAKDSEDASAASATAAAASESNAEDAADRAEQAAQNSGLPQPTTADAGKVPTVKADGSTYELAGPYAPIAAAIRPTASGNPVSITDSVEWPLQGLKVYGKSTQDGEPSPDNPVPIVSAGDSGSIAVTVSDGVDQSQQLSIQTPNGLPGIPVNSGGNYTDATGQRLTCNYRDYNSEKDFQWIGKTVVDGSTIKFVVNLTHFVLPYYSSPKIVNEAMFLCNYFPGNTFTSNPNYDFAFCRVERMKDFGISSDDEFNQLCQQWNSSGNPLTIYYTMDEPIESPIPTADLAAYRTLHTYDGATVVSTAEDVAGLDVRHVADAQKYIDNKIQTALAPVNRAILEVEANA